MKDLAAVVCALYPRWERRGSVRKGVLFATGLLKCCFMCVWRAASISDLSVRITSEDPLLTVSELRWLFRVESIMRKARYIARLDSEDAMAEIHDLFSLVCESSFESRN